MYCLADSGLSISGSRITSDTGLLVYRELDDALGLTDLAGAALPECPRGKNTWHHGRSMIFQMAEVAVPPALFQTVLGAMLRTQPRAVDVSIGGTRAPQIRGCRSEDPLFAPTLRRKGGFKEL